MVFHLNLYVICNLCNCNRELSCNSPQILIYFWDFLAYLRDPMLAKGWGQIVTPLFVQTPGGRQKMNFSTMKGIFRIIQAITSPKAEPFKQWIAQVASERLDQMQDPEKSIDQKQPETNWRVNLDALSYLRQKPAIIFCQITRKKRNDIPFC